ncbi:transcriptional regulator [Stomatobaculum longum]|nr:MAG TPA: bifunctional HTH-domain containing protein/aminotransferase [Caudoviricetes sp.]
MEKTSTSIRLKQLMSERNLRQVDILEACKPYSDRFGIQIQKSDLSQYVSGKTEPKQDKLSILGMALGVNEAWLMGYDVPSERTEFSSTPSSTLAARYGEDVLEAVELFVRLDAVDRVKITTRMEVMLEDEKYALRDASRRA